MRNKVAVVRTEPAAREEALALLFAELPDYEADAQVRQLLSAESRGELSLDGLLSVAASGRVVGVILYVMQADQCAYFWPPAVAAPAPDADVLVDALYAELSRRVKLEQAWIAQCLLAPNAVSERHALERNGFLHLADLDYLSRRLSDPLPAMGERLDFDTVPFEPAQNRDRFAGVIERTYVGSLDCPGLDGVRSGAEAITSHSATGVFMPEQWSIYRAGDQDIGVMILADHPDQDAWELVYMGIVPEARGRGFGKGMLHQGIEQAQLGGRESLLLAVDSRNRFARRVYDELGFSLLERRSVHVLFPGASPKNPQIVHSLDSRC